MLGSLGVVAVLAAEAARAGAAGTNVTLLGEGRRRRSQWSSSSSSSSALEKSRLEGREGGEGRFLLGDRGARAAARAIPRFVVDRDGAGHSGSNWLATLLSEAGLVSFFQFGGSCHDTPPASTAIKRLRQLLDGGCECVNEIPRGWPMRCTAAKYETCQETGFCKGACSHVENRGCVGVGAVAPPFLGQEDIMKIVHATRNDVAPVKYVAWLRDNAAKQAVSSLKKMCAGPAFSNHMTKATLRSWEGDLIPVLLVDPLRLLAKTIHQIEKADAFKERLDKFKDRVTHVAFYEDFQRDLVGEMGTLLRAIGVTPVKKPGASSVIVKSTKDSLADVLANFDDVDRAFAAEGANCSRAMLHSSTPERFSCRADPRFPDFLRYDAIDMHQEAYTIRCHEKMCKPETCDGNGYSEDVHNQICAMAKKQALKGRQDNNSKDFRLEVCVL